MPWRKWLAACRYCYSQAIALQRSGKRLSFLKLRNEIIGGDLPQWVKETPCHIRQNAVFEIQNGESDADRRIRQQDLHSQPANVHTRLGGSKVFHCPNCGLMLLRDWNGAFGIFLKTLRDNASIVFDGDSAIVALSGDCRTAVA